MQHQTIQHPAMANHQHTNAHVEISVTWCTIQPKCSNHVTTKSGTVICQTRTTRMRAITSLHSVLQDQMLPPPTH